MLKSSASEKNAAQMARYVNCQPYACYTDTHTHTHRLYFYMAHIPELFRERNDNHSTPFRLSMVTGRIYCILIFIYTHIFYCIYIT